MFKKLVLTCMLVLGMALSAGAAEQKFSTISVMVPEGWGFGEQDGVVALSNADVGMTIFTKATGGMSIEKIARDFALDVGGTPPAPKDKGYMVQFAAEGTNCVAMFGGTGSTAVGVVIIGAMTEQDMKDIMGSIKGNTPEVQAAVDTLR